MPDSLFFKVFFQKRYTKIVLLGLIGVGMVVGLVWLWQQREVSRPHFIAIQKVDGIEVDAGAKYQGLFLAGSAHEVEYEFSNPEGEGIADFELRVDAPDGILVTRLDRERAVSLPEPKTVAAEGGEITLFPAPLLRAQEKKLFTFRLGVDKEVPKGFYELAFHVGYKIRGEERRIAQKISIAVAEVSFTEKNSLEGVLMHPQGKLMLHFSWPEQPQPSWEKPRDILATLSQISGTLEEALRKETIIYEWNGEPTTAALREAVAHFGSEVGKKYANVRLNAIFENNTSLSPALELVVLDAFTGHLIKEGQRLFVELPLEKVEKKGTVFLSSLGTIASVDNLLEKVDGLFAEGLIKITKQNDVSISVDVSKYRRKYPASAPVGFLYAESKNKILSKHVFGKTDVFEALLDFTEGEGPWKVTFVIEDQGERGARSTSNALLFDTLPAGSAKVNNVEILGKVVGKYEASQGDLFRERKDFTEVDRATLDIKSSSGGYDILFLPTDEKKTVHSALKSVEVVEAKIEGGETKFTLRLEAAETHAFWLEAVTYKKDTEGITKELYRKETDKQSAGIGETITFTITVPGIYGEDFDELRLSGRANPAPILITIFHIALWIHHAHLTYEIIGPPFREETMPGEAAIKISTEPPGLTIKSPSGHPDWMLSTVLVNVGDLSHFKWRIHAQVPKMGWWYTERQYITYDLKVNGKSVYEEGRKRFPYYSDIFLTPDNYELDIPMVIGPQDWQCGKKDDDYRLELTFEADVQNAERVLVKDSATLWVQVENPYSAKVSLEPQEHQHHEDGKAELKVPLNTFKLKPELPTIHPKCGFVIDGVEFQDPHAQVDTELLAKRFPGELKCHYGGQMSIPVIFTKEKDKLHHEPHENIPWTKNKVSAHVEGFFTFEEGGSIFYDYPWKAELKAPGGECFSGSFAITDLDKEEEEPLHCPNGIVEKELGEECDPNPPANGKCEDPKKICNAECKCIAPPVPTNGPARPEPPQPPPPKCPNGIKEAGEECDGDASVCPGYGGDPFPGAICTAECKCQVLTRDASTPPQPPPTPTTPVEPVEPTPPTPACTSDGSCSAPTPACGQTTTGVDNCGNPCSRTGPVCPTTPTVKEEYLQHEQILGSNISDLSIGANTGVVDLTPLGGQTGIRITVPAGATIETFIEGTGQISSLFLPKFSPGFDFTNIAPGRTQIRNRNSDAENVVLYHIGYPNTANVQIRVTVTLIQ